MKIGIVGWDARTGIGTECWQMLPLADVWFAPPHSGFPPLPAHPKKKYPFRKDDLAECDVLLNFERIFNPDLLDRVRHIMVVHHEWFVPSYLDEKVTLVSPTEYCQKKLDLVGVDSRLVRWGVEAMPNTTPKQFCREFLHVAGGMGYRNRKGSDLVARASRLKPEVPLFAIAQTPAIYNVGFCRTSHVISWSFSDAREPYERFGDVAIQPSRVEGIGMSLLECQAAGIPLMLPAHAMYDEFPAIRRIPCEEINIEYPHGDVLGCECDPEEMAESMADIYGRKIEAHSVEAMETIARDWNIERTREELAAIIRE